MTRKDLKRLFRLAARDTVAPYLWSDEELNDYADDADNEACRRSHLLVSSTGDVAEAVFAAGSLTTYLNKAVIAIRRARMSSSTAPLRLASARDMDCLLPGWESATPSAPRYLVTDYQAGQVCVCPPPDADDILKMTVVHAPLSPMEEDTDEPSTPYRYHRSLVHWMLQRAYSKPDADTFDANKASREDDLFTVEFGPKVRAIDEQWNLERYQDIGEY